MRPGEEHVWGDGGRWPDARMVAGARRLVNRRHRRRRLAARPARPARAPAWPRRLVVGLVDAQAAAVHLGAVELLLGALGVVVVRHGDEAEAARLPGVAVDDDRDRLAGARLGEELAQLVLGHRVGEVADEELLGHLALLLSSAFFRLQRGCRWAMKAGPWR